jgi:hypothetical protein
MSESKYDKYFITNHVRSGPKRKGGTFGALRAAFPNVKFTGGFGFYSEPFVMIDKTHVHKYDDYLFFFGSNPDDISDFDAEWELCMGEEEEVHKINKTTLVYIPPGVIHCPLRLVKVNKPVFLMHIMDGIGE